MSATALWAPTAEALAREHPEFRDWLGLLASVRDEAAVPAWADAVPTAIPDRTAGVPRLAGATLAIEPNVAARWLRRLFDVAAAATPGLAGVADRLDPLAALQAGVELDTARMHALADAAHRPREPVAAVLSLAAYPWLQQCAASVGGRVTAEHTEAWCPICAAWATLAEARGLEGARRLRCGRCGADWGTEWLRCPFCGTDAHTRLQALVGGEATASPRADGCSVCGAWVKTITTLRPSDVETVRLLDLATVHLDIAALERGWKRPAGLGAPLGVHVVPRTVRRWWSR